MGKPRNPRKQGLLGTKRGESTVESLGQGRWVARESHRQLAMLEEEAHCRMESHTPVRDIRRWKMVLSNMVKGISYGSIKT